MVGVIGLARPTNVEDGLRWWIVMWIIIWIVIWIVAWISVLWKFSWETCFLTKFASLGLLFLVPFGGLSFGALLFFCIVQLVSFLVSSSFLFRFMATP